MPIKDAGCSKAKPNLLIVTFDQWRGDWGNPIHPVIKTACLSKLAKDGWTSQRCYTSSPQCVPARLSWITGLKPSELGVTRNQPANLPGNAPSFIREMKEKGWQSTLVGKTHWSDHSKEADLKNNEFLLKQLGFSHSVEIAGPRALRRIECSIREDWRKEGYFERQMEDLDKRYKQKDRRRSWVVKETVLPNHLYPDIWITQKGIEAIRRMPEDKPWILWVSYVGPHEPFDTPKPWKNMNTDKDIPKPEGENGWINRLSKNCGLKKVKDKWKGILNKQDIEELRKDYADHIRLLDDQLSRIIDAIEDRKDNVSTAVLVTSDHGEMLGDHNMLYKSTFLEESVRVPFVYRPPQNARLVDRWTNTERPLGLTESIHYVIQNLQNGGNIEPIEKWSRKQKNIISEYEDEIMIVNGWYKSVFNKNGENIWSTKLNSDPREKENLLESKYITPLEYWNIKKLKKQGEVEIKKRNNPNWIKFRVKY